MNNDHLSTTTTIFWGPKGGRHTQVWLYLHNTLKSAKEENKNRFLCFPSFKRRRKPISCSESCLLLIRIPSQVEKEPTRSRSYQTLFFFIFQFLLLSLSVCNIWKKMHLLYDIAKLNSKKKRKNYAFAKKKSLVWSTPGSMFHNISLFLVCYIRADRN